MAALAGNWVVPTPSRVARSVQAFSYQGHSDSSTLFWFSTRGDATTGTEGFWGASRSWGSLAIQSSKWGSCQRHGVVRLSRPVMAAQEAAQAEEEGTDGKLEEPSDEPSNGAPDTSPSLLEEFKAAVAANDEERMAELESQLVALESEKNALAEQVTGLLEETQTGRERLLRLNADFDNFRKRSQTEKASLSSTVRGDVIERLLPMIDNFERAKASIRVETEGEEKISKSYQSIYKQFVEIMKGLGVVVVETVGKNFDPNLHEAILREDSTEYEEGIVVQEFRRGFSIGEKLLRPAMVKVSAGPGPSEAGPGGAVGGEQEAEVLELKGDGVVE